MSSPTAPPERRRHAIATWNEGPLHAALKAWYALPGDRVEVPIDGRQIDLVRGDLLIEVQTQGLSALRGKLEALTKRHPVRLVYPVSLARWIVRVDRLGRVLGRRRSPRPGRLEDAFAELVSLPRLFAQESFSCELLLTHEEVVRRLEPGRARRRRGWVVVERRLVSVVGRRVLESKDDLRDLLPAGLPPVFTTADLASGLRVPRGLAQKMAYCLRGAGAIEARGKQGNSILYAAA
ncbi:MAG: hypothetical protein AB7N76_21605 [Planctomycetota bacterium]